MHAYVCLWGEGEVMFDIMLFPKVLAGPEISEVRENWTVYLRLYFTYLCHLSTYCHHSDGQRYPPPPTIS